MKDRFINIPLNYQTLDNYFIRTSIYKALCANLGVFKGRFLDVGCGKMPYKNTIQTQNITEYIGLDIASARDYGGPKPDITWDGLHIPLENASFDSAMATEVFEHCFDINTIVSEVSRVLKPGGNLFFTVPYIWPLHEVPYDNYRYTPFSLTKILENNGFESINIKPTGGWNASLAQMIGLWCRRSFKKKWVKDIVSLTLWPIIYLLIKTDKPSTIFTENTMYPSLYGTATKKA